MPIPPHSWLHQRAALEAFATALDPTARLAVKQSRLWGITSALKRFATTIGRTVYIPEGWTVDQARGVLPHEVLGHVRQFRWAGLGAHPTAGIFPGMFLVYVWGLVFPVLLAWGRYRCELHADAASWAYHLRKRLWTPNDVLARAERFAETVSSSAYAWAWPRRWAVWGFLRRARKVIRKEALAGG
jgi:hypothetical protein